MPDICSVLNTFFNSATTSARTDARIGMERVYRKSTLYRFGRYSELRVTSSGRSLVTPSPFKSELERMLTGRPLLNCTSTPIWLPSASALTTEFVEELLVV